MIVHTDKNGKELRDIRGYRLRNDDGEIFAMFGTGMKKPGDGDHILVWDRRNKLRWQNTKELSVVSATDGRVGLIAGVIILGILMLLASCQSSDDRAWADYSRGINHVLKQ